MKTLFTVAFDGEREAFLAAMLGELPALTAKSGASRAALDIIVGPDDLAVVETHDTEREAQAVISLWDPTRATAALDVALPGGARVIGGYLANEIVKRDYERTWDAGEASPGVKLVCLVRRLPALDPAAYLAHWRDRHGPLALAHQPGFWRYVQNHVVERLTETTPDFDGIGELHFRTPAEVLTGMFDSDEGAKLIWDDTMRFMSHEGSTTIPAKEYLIP